MSPTSRPSPYVRVPVMVDDPDNPDEVVPLSGIIDTRVKPTAFFESYRPFARGGNPSIAGSAPRVTNMRGTSIMFDGGLMTHVALPLEKVAELYNLDLATIPVIEPSDGSDHDEPAQTPSGLILAK